MVKIRFDINVPDYSSAQVSAADFKPLAEEVRRQVALQFPVSDEIDVIQTVVATSLAATATPSAAVERGSVAGGAAGNLTMTGVAVGDTLVGVWSVDGTGTVVDLTSEFTITATDTINNTDGTSTATKTVIAAWATLSAAVTEAS